MQDQYFQGRSPRKTAEKINSKSTMFFLVLKAPCCRHNKLAETWWTLYIYTFKYCITQSIMTPLKPIVHILMNLRCHIWDYEQIQFSQIVTRWVENEVCPQLVGKCICIILSPFLFQVHYIYVAFSFRRSGFLQEDNNVETFNFNFYFI